jgi:murein DD-endopeptidase MepM/ murein hydrolase activator NlpD
MADQNYTIIIVPGGKTNLRKFQISSRKAFFVLSALAVLVIALVATVTGFAYARSRQISKIQKENLLLKASLKESQVLTAKLNRKISNLTHLSVRLRSIAGLAQPVNHKQTTKLGMGGATLGNAKPETLLKLQQRADLLEQNLKMLHNFFEDRKAIPSLVPTQGLISSTFGARNNPFTGSPDFHEGLDISSDIGTPVEATADGTVVFAGFKGNFGRVIQIQHEYGFSTLFGHLERIMVAPGQHVRRGQEIGTVGNSGNSTGPHLHYEVHVNDQAVNPRPYLLDGEPLG